jgi:hypothetical protein
MVVIPYADRGNYLEILSICDSITGEEPYQGANATLYNVFFTEVFFFPFFQERLSYCLLNIYIF